MPMHSDINIFYILRECNFCWNTQPELTTYLASLKARKGVSVGLDLGDLDLTGQFSTVLYSQLIKAPTT